MTKRFLHIHSSDNALVALRDLTAGEKVEYNELEIELLQDIPAKHKFMIEERKAGEPVTMYGVMVGRATRQIPLGGLVTTENLIHDTNNYAVERPSMKWSKPDVGRWQNKTFNGYHRADGSVGTANYWLVIPLVFCENRNIDVLERSLSEALGYKTTRDHTIDISTLISRYQDGASYEELLVTELSAINDEKARRVFPNVDGIKFLRHQSGCGETQTDTENLCNLLAGYITHSNVAGATVLSLGCQKAQIETLRRSIECKDPNFSKPLHILEQQKSKNERAFIEEAIKLTFTGLIEVNQIERRPAPLSKLVLGLECGGSDGFSGISANPALGYASDLLVALGGSAILSEFPELHGVEQELINRCVNKENAEKFTTLMESYSKKAKADGSGFENNPSPGNIRDGLITDAMKSAGAAKKGGTSPVTGVLDYAEKCTNPGLNLLCTPGSDVESTTGLTGSGANVIVFTTGLGTPTGNPITPVIKVSTNTTLYQKMNDIIDFDTGSIISGDETITSRGADLLDLIIQVANGDEIPAAVRLGQNDFIPWKRGVSL